MSAIARVEGLAWNTVARWLERAASVCRRFSHGRVAGFVVEELQADDIRSFTGGKTRPTWIFAAIEVWSRLWPSTVVGRRSYRNTWALMRDVSTRMEFTTCPLIVTDGFEFYEKVVRRVFGPAVLYGQVLKTRRHDRIVQVERRARMGASWRFDEGLNHSEDSSTLNTSFIERMNLTIRQGLSVRVTVNDEASPFRLMSIAWSRSQNVIFGASGRPFVTTAKKSTWRSQTTVPWRSDTRSHTCTSFCTS